MYNTHSIGSAGVPSEGYVDRSCFLSPQDAKGLGEVVRGKAQSNHEEGSFFCVKAVSKDHSCCPRGGKECLYIDGRMRQERLTDGERESLSS